jgi:hypothetical protein
MLDDQHVSEPLSVPAYVLINPLFASGSKRAEQENCAFITNENVRGNVRSNRDL